MSTETTRLPPPDLRIPGQRYLLLNGCAGCGANVEVVVNDDLSVTATAYYMSETLGDRRCTHRFKQIDLTGDMILDLNGTARVGFSVRL